MQEVKQDDVIVVFVKYHDLSGYDDTTLGELKIKFKEESPEWLKRFINSLLKYGIAETRFCTYTVITD